MRWKQCYVCLQREGHPIRQIECSLATRPCLGVCRATALRKFADAKANQCAVGADLAMPAKLCCAPRRRLERLQYHVRRGIVDSEHGHAVPFPRAVGRVMRPWTSCFRAGATGAAAARQACTVVSIVTDRVLLPIRACTGATPFTTARFKPVRVGHRNKFSCWLTKAHEWTLRHTFNARWPM